MRVLFAELKRAIFSLSFLAAMAGTLIISLLCSAEIAMTFANGGMEVAMGEAWEQLIFNAIYSNLFLLMIPILCTLPYTGAFADDINSRFVRVYLPRAGRLRYLASRTAAVALSGGIAVTLGVIALMLIYIIVFPPLGLAKAGVAMVGTMFSLFQAIVLVFLNACFWAMVGGMAAAVIRNKYIAYACPFILYYVASSFQQRFYGAHYVLSPQEWIMPGHTNWYLIFSMVIGLCAVASAALLLLMKWRLKND